MGCVSSKLIRREVRREMLDSQAKCSEHVVSLTSTTYGLLKLDAEEKPSGEIQEKQFRSPMRETQEPEIGVAEVINAMELMKDLDEAAGPPSSRPTKSPSPRAFRRGFADVDSRSPLRLLSRLSSPRKPRRSSGKENKSLFVQGDESSKEADSLRSSFVRKSPPGGENAVVVYITTLRGIRKTFEDCNNVRSIIESHRVLTLERDISMDSGLKEELRGLMGGAEKAPNLPIVFVKGRLIGGVEEVVKLEEGGKLRVLLEGIPSAPAAGTCGGCAGAKFVMCHNCHGSCKVVSGGGPAEKRFPTRIRCKWCNENGLKQCPICC